MHQTITTRGGTGRRRLCAAWLLLLLPLASGADSLQACPRGQVWAQAGSGGSCRLCPAGSVKVPDTSAAVDASCRKARAACGTGEVAYDGMCKPCPDAQVPTSDQKCGPCRSGNVKVPAGEVKDASCKPAAGGGGTGVSPAPAPAGGRKKAPAPAGGGGSGGRKQRSPAPSAGPRPAGPAAACTPTTEVCNGLDDDCDGQVDEGLLGCGATRTDPSGGGGPYPSPSPASPSPSPSPSPPPPSPAGRCVPEAEICNGRDDDCDGVIDNGFADVYCPFYCGGGTTIKTCVSGQYYACTDIMSKARCNCGQPGFPPPGSAGRRSRRLAVPFLDRTDFSLPRDIIVKFTDPDNSVGRINCTHAGAIKSGSFDCDGDGFTDFVCKDNAASRRMTILSSRGCSFGPLDKNMWPSAPRESCAVFFNGCPQPPAFCTRPGMQLTRMDCDGDGVLDLACEWVDNKPPLVDPRFDRQDYRGVILSTFGCAPDSLRNGEDWPEYEARGGWPYALRSHCKPLWEANFDTRAGACDRPTVEPGSWDAYCSAMQHGDERQVLEADCDGDGLADIACKDSTGKQRGVVLSSQGCRFQQFVDAGTPNINWPDAPASLCPVFFV